MIAIGTWKLNIIDFVGLFKLSADSGRENYSELWNLQSWHVSSDYTVIFDRKSDCNIGY